MEEGKVFWMETMEPHLDLLLDLLIRLATEYFVDFDTTGVPISYPVSARAKPVSFTRVSARIISVNEYRT
jgi:hypothetical protein